MKKIAVVFFAALYLVSISGLAISNFYCCGKFKEAYIFQSKSEPRDCKGNKQSGCCDTKTVLVKVKDSHSASQIKINVNDFWGNSFVAHDILNQSFHSVESSLLALIHSPPLISE